MFCVSIHQVLNVQQLNLISERLIYFVIILYQSYKYLIEFRQSPRNYVLRMYNQKILHLPP